MTGVIRWGIIGAGRISQQFAHDMAYAPNGELSAVAARSIDDAGVFADKYGIPKAYGGYHELFADLDIDAVYIATPHTVHVPNMEAAVMAGKAVLCEKPITVSPEKCLRITNMARQRNIYVMEAMWTWFLPAVNKALEWLDAGRIGQLRHIKADFGYPIPYAPDRREYDNTLGGGCLLEMGIYPVALAWLLMRREPEQLHVWSHIAPNGVEDDVVMTLQYPDVIASLATSFRCKLNNQAYLIGEEGYIVIPDFWRASSCSLYKLEERIDHYEDNREGWGFEFQITAVGEDLLAGRKQSRVVTHKDSLAFQEQMWRVKKEFGGETS